MWQFIKYVLATVVGLFLFSVLSVLLLIGLGAALGGSSEKTVATNSVLELKLDKPISERKESDMSFGGSSSTIGLVELKQSIRDAKEDGDIKGILLNLGLVQGGMASLEEVRDALLDFKKSGKFVVAYHEIASEKSYYLSSVADRLYLHPQGSLEFNGLSSEVTFFKRLFDRAGIQPYIFRVGSFKSAVEPFFRENFSDSARLQTVSYLNSLNDHMLTQVAASRQIPLPRLRVISDSMLVHNAKDALRLKMVTQLGYFDEVQDYLRGKLGLKADQKPKLVSLSAYQATEEDDEPQEGSGKNRIAVVYAQGDIVTGRGTDDNIGSDKFAEAIRKARLDERVKAVVLRVNSPGGSSLASDIIYREVMLTKKVKPVVASMGDVAASGGYYISMGADAIVAHPNTITGSIGVFGVLPNIQPLLANQLGITVDRVNTGKFSDLPTITRPLSDYEKRQLQLEVNDIYADFTSKAAEGRRMDVARLRRLASGRVWSGTEAKERGLVDVLGSYDVALKLAADRAKLQPGDYRVVRLPRQRSAVQKFFSRFSSDDDDEEAAAARLLQARLGPLYPAYQQYERLTRMRGVQARLPYDLEIK